MNGHGEIWSLDLMLCRNMKELEVGFQHILFIQKIRARKSMKISVSFGFITLKLVVMTVLQVDWIKMVFFAENNC